MYFPVKDEINVPIALSAFRDKVFFVLFHRDSVYIPMFWNAFVKVVEICFDIHKLMYRPEIAGKIFLCNSI